MSNRNIQASVQGNSLGKRFLPVIGGGVTGLQSTPPRRGGAKNDGNKLSQKEKNGMIGHYEWSHLPPLPVSSWIEPASLLLTDTEFRSIDSPPLDLGLHFSSIDQWVLSDLDVGLDHLAESDTSGYQALNHPPFTVAAETESCVIEVSGLSSAAETELCISNVGSSSSVPENRKGGKRKHTESPLDGSKLLVDDIMAIFAAVRENYRPPPRLKFQIVLGTKGQKISPPSFEFRGETQKRIELLIANHETYSLISIHGNRWSLHLDETTEEQTQSYAGEGANKIPR